MLNDNNNIVLPTITNSNPKESFVLHLIQYYTLHFLRYNTVPLSTILPSFNNTILSAIISLLVFTLNTLCSTLLIPFQLLLFKVYYKLIFIVHLFSSFLLSTSLKYFPVLLSSDSNTNIYISFTDTNIVVASVSPHIFQTKVKEEETLGNTIPFYHLLPFDIYKPEQEEIRTIEHNKEETLGNLSIPMDEFLPSVFFAPSPSSIFITPCSTVETFPPSSSKPPPCSVMISSDPILPSPSTSSQRLSPQLFLRSKKRSVLRRKQYIIPNITNDQLHTD